MPQIARYRGFILIVALLIIFYFITRLYNLMLMPLFTDEAIYVRWAQIGFFDAGWRFISLTDGKQPSFVWLTIVLMKFIGNPLAAGRLVSVGAGLATMVGIFFLTSEIFKNKKMGLLASFLYAISPFAIVYDKMALYDGLVGTFMTWSLYFQILLVRKNRLDLALILGMIMGGAVLTKSSGFIAIYLLPFSLLLFNLAKNKRIQRFIIWIALAIVSITLTYLCYSILRLSPFFHMIDEKNSIFIYTFSEWRTHQFTFFWGNFLGLWDWLIGYMSWPIIFLTAGSFLVKREFTREKLLLFIWFTLPFFMLALFGKILYPRFIFFMTLPLLPLAALSFYTILSWIKKPVFRAIAAVLLLLPVFHMSYFVLTNPYVAPIPASDKNQYLNAWPAGGGIREMVAFFSEQAKDKKIFVGTEGTFGSLPTIAMEIYFMHNELVEKHGFWPIQEKIPDIVLEKAKIMPTYFVFNQGNEAPSTWPVKVIAKHRKGIGSYYLYMYEVIPTGAKH